MAKHPAGGAIGWKREGAGHVGRVHGSTMPVLRQFNGIVQRVRRQFPNDVAYVFVHTPIRSHPYALSAARAAECAQSFGRFSEMVDAIYERQDSLGSKPWTSYALSAGINDTMSFGRCARDTVPLPAVQSGLELSKRINVIGTPTVILNGWRYGVAPGDSELVSAIKSLLDGKKPYRSFPTGELVHRGS